MFDANPTIHSDTAIRVAASSHSSSPPSSHCNPIINAASATATAIAARGGNRAAAATPTKIHSDVRSDPITNHSGRVSRNSAPRTPMRQRIGPLNTIGTTTT